MALRFSRTPEEAANKALTKMKYLDLQAAVIIRGMDFQEIVDGDYPRLASFFVKNYEAKKNKDLLEAFDTWVDNQLKDRGYKKSDPFRKFRRFSALTHDGDSKVRTRRLKNADLNKTKKPKKERDTQFGIFKGTKKEYTFTQSKDLFEKKGEGNTVKDLQRKFGDQMVERVTKKFPDAKEKSIKIWMKRCLDELYKKKKGN